MDNSKEKELNNKTTLNILGTDYSVEIKAYNDDPMFPGKECFGYCDSHSKTIVVCDSHTDKESKFDTEEELILQNKETIRHEIVHAFFNESGLQGSSGTVTAWAQNEEMVDWIAIQFHKIEKVIKQAEEWYDQWQSTQKNT